MTEQHMSKLTKPQIRFLQEAFDNRRDHGRGRGATVFDRHDARVANALERKGLIIQPPAYTHILGAHITPAGRAALANGAEGK